MRKEPVLRDLITSQENAYHPLFSTWGQSFPFIKSRFKLPLPSYSGRWFFFFFLFRNFFFFFFLKKALEWCSLIFSFCGKLKFYRESIPFLNWWFVLLNEQKSTNGVIFSSGKV